MKLFRYREGKNVKPGILIEEKMFDASALVHDYNEDFFANDGLKKLASPVEQNKSQLKALSKDVTFDSCVARPS